LATQSFRTACEALHGVKHRADLSACPALREGLRPAPAPNNLRPPKHLRGRTTKRPSDLDDVRQRHIPDAALDPAVVAAIQPCLQRDGFLGHAALGA
jgi:hypothetical protein